MQQPDAPSLPLSSIAVDWTINARAAMRREITLEYAEALKAGARFPPVTVFFDGATYWLADGFHRYVAYEIAGIAEIPVEIRLGTPRAAALYSAAANGLHGLRPTKSDRRKAIIRLLEDPEWALWTNQQIAELCGAEPDMVDELRRTLDRFMANHAAGASPAPGVAQEGPQIPKWRAEPSYPGSGTATQGALKVQLLECRARGTKLTDAGQGCIQRLIIARSLVNRGVDGLIGCV